ncbi:MAG: hypothetical protein OHK0032_12090 [Thermodesulfovibrionales bacterium]
MGTSLFVYMPIIFFVYGISFFMLGITIAAEHIAINTTGSRFKHFVSSPVGSLSVFGLIHSSVEFMDMLSILYGGLILPLKIIRLLLMSASFYFLCRFGVSYTDKDEAIAPFRLSLPKILFGMWFILVSLLLTRRSFGDEWFIGGEVLSRYIIGLPSALVASVAVLKYRMKGAGSTPNKFQIMASIGFVFYAVFGGLIVPMAKFYPASTLNYESFYSAIHVPVQLFRSICAILITIALLKFFRLSKEFSTIKFKAILHTFIAVLIPGLVTVLFVCYMIADALLDLSYRENEKLAAITANRVFSFFDNVKERVRYYALFSRLVPPGARKDILISLVRDADINGIALIDEKREIFRIEKDPPSSVIRYNDNGRNFYTKRFLNASITDVTDMPFNKFYIKGHTDKNVIMVIPLMKGSIEVLLSLDKLYGVISNVRIEKGWHALLLDDRGDIVIPWDRRQLKGKEVLGHRDLDQGIYGKPIFENGIYYNAIEEKISPIGWSVIIEIPRDEIVAPVFRVFKGVLFGVFVVNLTAIVVVLIFVEKVTKPISLIARNVRLIARGDFDQRLNLRTGDELQTLSEDIEDMAKSLKEKKKMEEEIIQTEKIASLGRLTAGIAHEINNPLGIILGYCQVMLREISPDNKYYGDLKTIEKHVLACKRILEDLLKFSRPYRKVNAEVDINTNIKEALALIPKHFLKEKIKIILELSPVSPVVIGDPDKLHQLFLNLAMNAIDAMKDGGSLVISTKDISEDMVEIVFRDTGCGIREEDLGRIFDPFFTTKEVGKGTGLGLSVSYGIVKDHRGEIWAESILGKGTTFHIIFPVKKGYGQ